MQNQAKNFRFVNWLGASASSCDPHTALCGPACRRQRRATRTDFLNGESSATLVLMGSFLPHHSFWRNSRFYRGQGQSLDCETGDRPLCCPVTPPLPTSAKKPKGKAGSRPLPPHTPWSLLSAPSHSPSPSFSFPYPPSPCFRPASNTSGRC